MAFLIFSSSSAVGALQNRSAAALRVGTLSATQEEGKPRMGQAPYDEISAEKRTCQALPGEWRGDKDAMQHISRFLIPVLLLVAWGGSTLLAGLWAHVPILGLFVPLLLLAALASWLGYFALLRPAAGATTHRVTTGGRILAWVLAVAGGLLLTLTATFIGGFVGDELLQLERRVFLEQRFPRPPRGNLWQPLMYQVGWRLLGWMALWFAELSLLCLAIRLRAGWEPWKLLLLGAAFALIPLLIVFLIFFLNLPLTA